MCFKGVWDRMTTSPSLLYVVAIVGGFFIIYSLIKNWLEDRKTLSHKSHGEDQ